jgi:hypothetical protein
MSYMQSLRDIYRRALACDALAFAGAACSIASVLVTVRKGNCQPRRLLRDSLLAFFARLDLDFAATARSLPAAIFVARAVRFDFLPTRCLRSALGAAAVAALVLTGAESPVPE